ncbi:Asp23/Gls24 family envelope stress response protein [Irregularibacter muris]|uniref:Asp23/Gls24 family envelope stress response protein n=1 Tax=Irregularibacter muris TaxID=1796619 RepID=A0AAE3HEG0_9FIRM|nr:Asp23/Gls24 family envelope stress response protein [Irregularibacter muris]MCR1897995.1 Asp23/Gls24 family envelope stress response protein [Irregularibacter muris]
MEKSLHNEGEQFGKLNISDDVLSTIASIAASEVKGVTSMSGGITGGIVEMLGKKPVGKGVKIEIEEEKVKVDIFLVVNYGVRIPDVAWEVQENVKKSIEAMAGLKVAQVNINVQGVNFQKVNPKEGDLKSQEEK